jgi:hypothetical protein
MLRNYVLQNIKALAVYTVSLEMAPLTTLETNTSATHDLAI